jgi:uncharacterized membrane protein SirB2
MSIMQWCESLEMTALGVWVRESLYGFPFVVAIHILGLTLSVGMVVWFDLRLLGLSMRRCPVSEVYRRIFPWMISGMLVMATTGVVLFIAFATKAYSNTYFRIKLASIVLAGLNALYFHLTTERSITRWNDATRPPAAARFAGFASLALWTAVIMAGRMMSYTMF